MSGRDPVGAAAETRRRPFFRLARVTAQPSRVLTMQELGDLLRRAVRATIVSGLVLYLLMQAVALVGKLEAVP